MSVADNAPSELMAQLRAALGTQYSVERLLGLGGMGAVFLGRDLTLDRPVAIKVINPEVASNTTLRERFLQEARTVARLRHPNIVSVYAAGEANGLLYFVMEYVPGESLRELMAREGKLTGERAEHILRGIALALDNAHTQGMVHRDVKPENILLDKESGRAMLTDFGVSRAFEKEGGLTQTGMILGSPRYMSPEQASGDKAVDGRSDLYSLALVGYEIYTGAPVVQSGTAASMLVKHLTETPAPLSEKQHDVPEHVASAIDRGLAKDPAERWQTGREFAEGLAGQSLTPTGELRSSSSSARAKRGHAKRRRVAIIAAVTAAVVAGAWFAFGRGSVGKAYLVAPFEIQSGDQSVAWLRDASVNMLTLTLGQWGDLQVVDYERTLSLIDKAGLGNKTRVSLDDALALARRANAGQVVTGQIQTINDSIIVVAKLYDVRSGKSENSAQEAAPLKADPRPMFDRIAQKLLAIAGGPTSAVQLAQATTTSIEAYRAYLEGVRLLNSWDLIGADREFRRAIDIDSTFALAYHKWSLGLGWADAGSRPEYKFSAQRAFDLSSRLPARERALVEGHYHMTLATTAASAGDSLTSRAEFAKSIKSFTDLIARGDSLVAEAWYGLADALYHGRTYPSPTFAAETQRTLRGFNKTLAIDSTFHLAYSHLVQLYNQAGSLGSPVIMLGDSVIELKTEADIQRLGGQAGVERMRQGAREAGIAISRAWNRADPKSSIALAQLGQSYFVNKQPDSAIAVMRAGLTRPLTSAAMARVSLLAFQEAIADTGAGTTVRYILDHFTRDSLREVTIGQRVNSHGTLMTQAAMTGNSADVARAAKLFAATDSVMPFSTVPTKFIIDFFSDGLRIAMGDSIDAGMRRNLITGLQNMEKLPAPLGNQARTGSVSIPYLAFMATRDTAYLAYAKKWLSNATPELDALAALAKNDTATARRLAQTFPTPDSLRKVQSSMAGMRSYARAEVLAALGLNRQAAETYEAIVPERMVRQSLAEPGYVVWVRTFLARARLWAQLGEREKAVAAYEEFIRRWKDADGVAAKQVTTAKQELAALRDAPKKQ